MYARPVCACCVHGASRHAFSASVGCVQIKCHRYYPESGSQVFGMFTVSLKREECLAEYTVRELMVEGPRDGQPLHVTQFHFTAWPDHGVPQYATGLLSFRNRVNQHHVSHKASPMVVHCSAGVGRTGTYIAVDILLKKMEAEGVVDVFNVVRQLRWHRKYMVQTVVSGTGGEGRGGEGEGRGRTGLLLANSAVGAVHHQSSVVARIFN